MCYVNVANTDIYMYMYTSNHKYTIVYLYVITVQMCLHMLPMERDVPISRFSERFSAESRCGMDKRGPQRAPALACQACPGARSAPKILGFHLGSYASARMTPPNLSMVISCYPYISLCASWRCLITNNHQPIKLTSN